VTPDAFGTAALRRAVLEAWRSSPTRLREDANTEEDHAHGSYRDRVVVELAQNAADAAARAGVPGRLLLALVPPAHSGGRWTLRAANTGAPLDADGVASLAAMRASATGARAAGAVVGRFGVGFAAVRSVGDDVRVGADGRAVGFSLDRTRAALEDVVRDDPALAAEVARRGDRLPVLRLPFPATVDVPAGYATVVEVELRDAEAVAAVRAQLADVGDPLLLALPALDEVVVEDGTPRRVADVAARWTVVRRAGEVDPALLAGLPVEERARSRWSVTWALPRRDEGVPAAPSRAVVHAPTPTDEPTTFPALLLASFPLDPSRRHVAPGALADDVARRAGEAYAELLGAVAAERGADVLALVPSGLPAGTVDALVREAAVDALRRTPLLAAAGPERPDEDDPLADPVRPGAAPGASRLARPVGSRVLLGDVGGDPRVRDVLGVPGLVSVPAHLLPVARALGVEVLDLATVVDGLPAHEDPARRRALYDALAPHAGDRGVAEALASLPVPLADGRTVRGARGLLLVEGLAGGTDGPRGADATAEPAAPAAPTAPAAPAVPTVRDVAALGLRVVDPEAAHPLLERLGARRAGARDLVVHDALRERVLAVAAAADDGEDVDAATRTLLALVAIAAGESAQGLDAPFWWGELPLPAGDGGTAAARSLVLPGSWGSRHLDLDPVDAAVVERWGAATLRAVGVVDGPAVHAVRDVLVPVPGEEPDLAAHEPQGWLSDWSRYLDHLADVLGPGTYVGDVAAVADLDAVADDAWGEVLATLAADPPARAALLDPVRAAGRERAAPSYTAWWLREELGGPFALGDVPFLRPAPPEVDGLDRDVLVALGGVPALVGLAPDGWADLLDDLPPVGARVEARDAVVVWRALAALAARGETFDPAPDRVPALGPAGVVVADAADVVVAADPMWAPLRAVVPVPAGLVDAAADLLDADVAPGSVPVPDGAGSPAAVPGAVQRVLADAPATWAEHGDLRVGGVPVPWWVVGSGADARVHATGRRSLAEALAASSGRYGARHVVAEVLRDPARVEEVVARTAWDAADGRA